MKNAKMKSEGLVVITASGKHVTTSEIVARALGKDHAEVIVDILALPCSKKFKKLNFKFVKPEDAVGHEKKAYKITRDGFSLLAKEYHGKNYDLLKDVLLNQFSLMGATKNRHMNKNLTVSNEPNDSNISVGGTEKEADVLGLENLITSKALAKELGIGIIKFNKFLKVQGIIYKHQRKWLPFQEFLDKGYMIKKRYFESDAKGYPQVLTEFFWTFSGREFLVDKYNNQDLNYQFSGKHISQFQAKLLNLAMNGWKIQREYRSGNQYLYAVRYINRKKQRMYLGKAENL